MQISTISLQTEYDMKLIAATSDAIKAFQINTANSSTSDIANSKIRDIEASVSTFKASIKSVFGMNGYSEDEMNEYIPALVYTMYDGFYIYSRFNNQNYLYEVDENGNVTENKDPVLVKKTISKETSDIIKDYMQGVVEEGTGASAAVEGYAVGGKTGTAEKLPRGNGKYLVSFIGYAPQENPQVMVYVVIDEPNSAVQANSGYATQLASQIMTDIFPYLGVEKKDGASDTCLLYTSPSPRD